jgi:hypothetical protein
MAVAPPASKPASAGRFALDFARRQTLRLVQDIPSDKLTWQPLPEANHALWVLGHLAWTEDSILVELAGRTSVLGESWKKHFGAGSKPSGNRSAYPPVEQIKAGLDRSRKALLEWLGSMDERKLASPLPSGWDMFAPTFGDLPGSLAWHEGLHAGQVSVVRRGLGLPPTM